MKLKMVKHQRCARCREPLTKMINTENAAEHEYVVNKYSLNIPPEWYGTDLCLVCVQVVMKEDVYEKH